MSIKDMFAMQKAYGDPLTNGLKQWQNILSVENDLNKVWQDGLTFNKNVNAINAANAKKAYDDQIALMKSEGEHEAKVAMAPHLYDHTTGKYRPEANAWLKAAWDTEKLDNPYASLANYDGYRTAQLQAANAIAPYDPAQAIGMTNSAWGNLGIRATQNKDGSLNITNAQGYTRYEKDPNIAALWGVNPAKTAGTLAEWQRDDNVANQTLQNNMTLHTHQSKLNRANDAYSKTLAFRLNESGADADVGRKTQLLENELELKKKYGLLDWQTFAAKEAAKNGGSNGSSRDLESWRKYQSDMTNKLFTEMVANGEAPDQTTLFRASNIAKTYADNLFGFYDPQSTTGDPATPAQNIYQAAAKAQTQPDTTKTTTPTKPTPQAPLHGFFPETRFGFYTDKGFQRGFGTMTRQERIADLENIINYYTPLFEENKKTNPNAPITQNQGAAIQEARSFLNKVNKMSDSEYYQEYNPASYLTNWLLFGEGVPKKYKK